MRRGAKVLVSGAKAFSGTVLAMGSDRLVIEIAPGVSTTLFRDFASTNPQQWHCAGLPVQVREDMEGFRKLLRTLEQRTRKL